MAAVTGLFDAADEEVGWLTAADTLPTLLSSAGGPWDVVQAYLTRTPATRKTALYVLLPAMREKRISNGRKQKTYNMRIRVEWPIGSSTTGVGLWEDEQRALGAAVDKLFARLRGTLLDHTHGGRFLSVAEEGTAGQINATFEDPDHRSGQISVIRGLVTYIADGYDFEA
jgi:hypothetical protein